MVSVGKGYARRPRWGVRAFLVILSSLCAITILTACNGNTEPEVGYKPSFLPIKFLVSPSGIKVSGESSIITPIGEFSIGASYSLPKINTGHIYVIIRDRKEGRVGYDHIYDVNSGNGQFAAVVNGKTLIQVSGNQVLIDVTNGRVDDIRLKHTSQVVAEGGGKSWWNKYSQRWDRDYSSSFYKPFDLFRWAYDTSTVNEWYGVGFAWFLIRLIFALILGVVDVLATIIFLLGAVAYMFIGPGARDFIYGLGALLIIILAIIGIAGLIVLKDES